MRQQGFTLLELLVVLALVGMIAGVVGPRFYDMVEKLRYRNAWQTLQQRINRLPLDAQLAGRAVTLQGDQLPMPAGWMLQTEHPVRYLANGVCLGGELQLLQDDAIQRKVILTAPYCQWKGRAW